jgi:hypothetical protein
VGNDVIATVSSKNWQLTKAIARIGNMRWHFDRQGFWRYRYIVSSVDTGETVALFERNRWGYGGTLTWSNGRSVDFRSAEFRGKQQGWGRMQWTWFIDNQSLLHFNSKNGWFVTEARVNVMAINLLPDDIAFLLTFGWYLLMMKKFDVINGAVIIAAVILYMWWV